MQQSSTSALNAEKSANAACFVHEDSVDGNSSLASSVDAIVVPKHTSPASSRRSRWASAIHAFLNKTPYKFLAAGTHRLQRKGVRILKIRVLSEGFSVQSESSHEASLQGQSRYHTKGNELMIHFRRPAQLPTTVLDSPRPYFGCSDKAPISAAWMMSCDRTVNLRAVLRPDYKDAQK
jgi:hypothetical protein